MRLKVLVILSVAYFAHVASREVDKVCEEGSLNKLVLDDLLVKAKTSDQCLEEARKTFKTKYSAKPFYIRGPFSRDETKSIARSPDRVTVSNLNVATNLFETFNELISSVHISFDEISAPDGKAIVKLLNDKVSESLTHLTLENCKENVLDELSTPLKNVASLRFSSNLPSDESTVNNKAVSFNTLFPNLIELDLGHTRVPEWTLIGDKFPKITTLTVESPVMDGSDESFESFVVELLKKSRKITNLTLIEPSLVVLKAARKSLTKLKALTIKNLARNYHNSKRDIHFERVKNLTIYSNAAPDNIMFDNIDTLDLHVESEFTDKWADFLESQVNVGIQRLNIDMESVQLKNFLSIATTLQNLKFATVTCLKELSIAEVLQFVKKFKRAEKIDMKFLMEKTEHNKLKAKFNAYRWRVASADVEPFEETYSIDLKLERLEKGPFDNDDDDNGDDDEAHGDDGDAADDSGEDNEEEEEEGSDDDENDSDDGADSEDGDGDSDDSGSDSLAHSPIVILSIALIFALFSFN